MSLTEVSNEFDALESPDRIKQQTQIDVQKIKSVTRTVWLKLPEIPSDVVLRLRRLYTQAIRRFIQRLMEGNCSEKQIYHELRKHPTFSKLPARMLNRIFLWQSFAIREKDTNFLVLGATLHT